MTASVLKDDQNTQKVKKQTNKKTLCVRTKHNMRILSFFVLINNILLNLVCVWILEEREREREEEKRRNRRAPFHWIHCENSIPPRLTNDSLNTASRWLHSHGKERAIVHQLPTTRPQQNQSYCSQCLWQNWPRIDRLKATEMLIRTRSKLRQEMAGILSGCLVSGRRVSPASHSLRPAPPSLGSPGRTAAIGCTARQAAMPMGLETGGEMCPLR